MPRGFGIFAAVSSQLCLSTLLRRSRARCVPPPRYGSRRRAVPVAMALRSPELRWLGSLTRPGRLAPSPLAALASPRRRRRAPSPSQSPSSPSPSDSSTPSTAPASAGKSPLRRSRCWSSGDGEMLSPRVCFSYLVGAGRWAFPAGVPGAEGLDGPEWKKVSAKRFGIKESMIPAEAWNVLHRLRSRGASPTSMAMLVFGLFSCPILKRHCWSWISEILRLN